MSTSAASEPVVVAQEPKRFVGVLVPYIPTPPYYACGFGACKARLHNLETLQRHVRKFHAAQRDGGYVCLWPQCQDAVVRCSATSGVRRTTAPTFATESDWFDHVDSAHLEDYAWEFGDGFKGGYEQDNAIVVNDSYGLFYRLKTIRHRWAPGWHAESTVERNSSSSSSRGEITAATALGFCCPLWGGETPARSTGALTNPNSFSFAQLTSLAAVDTAQPNIHGPDAQPPGRHEWAGPEGFTQLAVARATLPGGMSAGSTGAMSHEALAGGTSSGSANAMDLDGAFAGGATSGLQTPMELGATASATPMGSMAGSSSLIAHDPPVVGRGILPSGEWFSAHGFRSDVEKAQSAIDNLRSLYYEDGQDITTGPDSVFTLHRTEPD